MQNLALKILHSNCCQVILPLASAPQNLPPFYFSCNTIPPHAGKTEAMVKIEFSHAQLGQFLCAQAIVEQLITIALYCEENYGQCKFILDSPGNIAQQIYNLLGYGFLIQR